MMNCWQWHVLYFISNDVEFANAFTNKEPAPNFNSNQGIQTGFTNGEVLPFSGFCCVY